MFPEAYNYDLRWAHLPDDPEPGDPNQIDWEEADAYDLFDAYDPFERVTEDLTHITPR